MSASAPPLFSEVIARAVNRYSAAVWLLLLAIALGVIGNKIVSDALRANARDVPEENLANYPQRASNLNTVTVYFFHVDWCKFCTKAKPVWANFVKTFQGRPVHGYTVDCADVDVTGDHNGVDPALKQQYNLSKYPTVKIVCRDKVTLLDANVTLDALSAFVRDVTQ